MQPAGHPRAVATGAAAEGSRGGRGHDDGQTPTYVDARPTDAETSRR